MRRRTSEGMRAYWDDGARRNAAWYVDTTLSYDEPDMDRFFAGGQHIVRELFDRTPVEPAARDLAVEIGSGLGRVCLALADRFDRVIGVDISPEMVQRAEELVRDPRVTFRVGDGVSLSGIEDACADLVLSFTVFQHIPSPDIVHGYLREAGRILRAGGVLVFQWNNIPGVWRWNVRRSVLATLQRTGLYRERYARHAPEFLGSRIALDPLKRTLEASGLELVGSAGLGTLFAQAWGVRRS